MMFRSFFLCLSRGVECVSLCVCLCVWVGLGQRVCGLSVDGFDAVARCLELG
jgi:hypothetical protein